MLYCEGYVFTHVCLSTGGGGIPGQVPPEPGTLPQEAHTPRKHTPPGSTPPRSTPPEAHRPGGTPQEAHPPRSTHPPRKHTPGEAHPPGRWLTLWTVCILLECILVWDFFTILPYLWDFTGLKKFRKMVKTCDNPKTFL